MLLGGGSRIITTQIIKSESLKDGKRMQMTAEQKSLMIKIGIGVVAVILVGAITVLIAHLLYPPVAKTVPSTSSVASKTPTPAVSVAPAPGSTASINSLTTQDSSSESSINTTYENSNVVADQASNQAAVGVGSAYDESSY
jgi:FlaG/FlaF family flagellin (archaellin)